MVTITGALFLLFLDLGEALDNPGQGYFDNV